jgi:ribonuclease D
MRLATGMLPARLFDTQVAAALLGHQPQIGYAGAVEAVLGEKLDKAHARADWTRRPLPADQLAYALEDVVHLPALATRLREDLIAGGRLDWALEDSARLLEPGLYDNPPEDAWQRIKGFGRLRGAERAAAATLAAWREREAVERDRPRQWILSDAVLLATAVARPTDVRALRAVAGMPGGLVRRAGDALLHALEAPPPEAAMRAPAGPPSDEEKSRLAALAKALGKAADALGIETSVLATRADMMDVIRGRRRGKLFEGWRREAVGPTVERYLPEEVATAIESAVER